MIEVAGGWKIHGEPFAVRKYERLKNTVTWHIHSRYGSLDIWVGKTHYGGDIDGKNAHIYKAYPSLGHVCVGASLTEIEKAIREYKKGKA